MIIRAKTKYLCEGRTLSEIKNNNSKLNLSEIDNNKIVLNSYPRRLVLELTNACNLNCVMCGRNVAEFKPMFFDMETFRSLEPVIDKVEEVTLMGWGEPTIHPNFIEMLETINKHGARIYFCSNGMNLKKIRKAIFDNHVDVFAVSLDGATDETNSRIRRGSKINQITDDLRSIVKEKKERGLKYPWINFVFCAINSNIHELPMLVELADEIGIEEVKVVYLTVFDKSLENETLWGKNDMIREYFQKAVEIAEKKGIIMKLPYIPGEDIAEDKFHKDCYDPWRDFFLGSDGYVRPCMSTPVKLFKYDPNKDFMEMWNDKEYQRYRRYVNDQNNMDEPCRLCYQSSFCNWNRESSFIRYGSAFSPEWKE
jgi:radical SAM protein with 4Fe4S-binding SPASM domain